MDNAIRPPDRMNASTPPLVPTASEEVDWTGQVLGEFRILHRLGKGGMGQVYLAEQTSLKRKVALKLLNPDLASNDRSLNRFKAEAENVARATHANIVQIYTIGQANGINYIALEFVEGKNLREFIEKKGTPELALGLHIIMQVAAALQRASELGIIHRDIKPENILLTKKGEVKVADFGLSRCFAESAEQVSLTQSQVTMGTPLYMSPEQVERRPVDPRTDIYSFGVTCYHMFAGTPPFRGTSPIEVAYQHVHKEPQSLAEIRPDLPPELVAIIQKMMAKKPEDRYQTAGEIVRDVNRLRESLNLGTIAAVSISSSFLGGAATHPWPETMQRSQGTWRTALFGLVIFALVGGVVLGWYQQHPADPIKDPPPANPHPEDPANGKVNLKERERELKQRVSELLKPGSSLDAAAGLKHCVDLGQFYLQHNQFDDADEFFKDISKPDREVPAYRFLGRLGHAMVLAFKDDPVNSNKEFVELDKYIKTMDPLTGKGPKKGAAPKDEVDAFRYVWKENPAIRELSAKALNHNYANKPAEFPKELDVYRFPPKPSPKVAPTP